MIQQETIDAVRAGTDLAELIRSRGIVLKKKGKNYIGLCPFHEDTDPSLSVNPAKKLWNCFGCGAGGDAIRFVEMYDRLEFPDAVKQLAGVIPDPVPGACPEPAVRQTKTVTAQELRLLARVTEYYQHTMGQNPRGLNYLKEERGIRENQSLKDFGAGYADGTLLGILPEDKEIIASLKRIGILNSRGKEFFGNCAVFPLYSE
ncbi:MAG: hypothetical protein GY729_10670, partial [Desulfobacteraceae bacterium]|nr:hypothetical protein [Desulfobacteraceae bacterium]